MRFGAAIPVMNEFRFLPAVVGQLLKVCDRVAVLRNDRSLSGAQVRQLPLPKLPERVEVHQLSVGGIGKHDVKILPRHVEADVRNAGMEILADCDHVFILDSDEVVLTSDLVKLRDLAARGHRAVACYFHTYWKTPRYLIDPGDRIPATVIVRRDVRFQHMRVIDGQPHIFGGRVVHHLSYVRTEEEVREKLRLYGHAHQVGNVDHWIERVWRRWNSDKGLQHLHPVHPWSFVRAIPTESAELEAVLREHGVSLEGLG